MTARAISSVVLIALLVIVVPAQPVGAGYPIHSSTEDATQAETVLVVDDSGGAEYTTISAAVDAADDGDTVRVRPGTYREAVTLDSNVTLVAPRGATLDGRTLDGTTVAIDVRTSGAPVVDGFRIANYEVGVEADTSIGDWVLRNVTIHNASWMAVSASQTTGDWTLRNVTITGGEEGVVAKASAGNWIIRDSTIRHLQDWAIRASLSTGSWRIHDTTIGDVLVGVGAYNTSGDWELHHVRIRNTTVGVGALESSGDWLIRDSIIRNTTVSPHVDFMRPPFTEGVGVHASRTSGMWRIHDTTFLANSEGAIIARGAEPSGNATENTWGGELRNETVCVGNVTCTIQRSVSPTATPTRTASPTGTLGATGSDQPATQASTPLSPALVVVALLVVASVATRLTR